MALRQLPVEDTYFPPDAIWVEPVEHLDFEAWAEPRVPRRSQLPHRHDFHEIIWTRSGRGSHLLDGRPVEVGPGTLLIIGRRQVHEYVRARQVEGIALRFDDELAWSAAEPYTSRLLSRGDERRLAVPPSDVPQLEALLLLIEEKCKTREQNWRRAIDIHLLSVLFTLLETWHEITADRQDEARDGELRLYDRFIELLSVNYASEHGSRFYADALRVSPAALGRAVARASGRTTKALILDQVLNEAVRLLQFTDLSVGQVANRVGFDDAFYFSRMFKRHRHASPLEFRLRARRA
jgi:AraC family transcriptional activator of pobA